MRIKIYDPAPDYAAIAKAAQQIGGAATEITHDEYHAMLGETPPQWVRSAAHPTQFFVLEATTSCGAGPVHLFLARIGSKYYAKYGIPGEPVTFIGYESPSRAYPLEA